MIKELIEKLQTKKEHITKSMFIQLIEAIQKMN